MIIVLVSLLGGCSVSKFTNQNIENHTSQKYNESLDDKGSLNEKEKETIQVGGPSNLAETEEKKANSSSLEEVKIYYFDVGQGDSTLLLGPDFTVLIDVGRHDRKDVIQQLKEVGVTDIDLMLLTHPHADHIGPSRSGIECFPCQRSVG